MPSINPLIEEGRTRWRNFFRRLIGYLGLWLLLGLVSGALFFQFHTRRSLEPFQRLYLKQYAIGSFKAWALRNSSTNYILLVQNITDRKTGAALTIGITDALAYLVRDDEGRPVRDRQGFVFKPYANRPGSAFYWKRVRVRDGEMAVWLQENIYQRLSFPELWLPAGVCAVLIFIFGAAITIAADYRFNRRYEEGKLLRGTRKLSSKEYKEQGKEPGLGIVDESQEGKGWLWSAFGRDRTCWLRIPRAEEAEHVLLTGDPGTGKSQLMHCFLSQIAQRTGESAVIYDPACEFLERHFNRERGDIILNPLDMRFPFWSPSAEVKLATDRHLIAESFFPGRANETGAPVDFFLKASRNIFARMLEFGPTPEELVQWLADANKIDRFLEGTEHVHLIDSDAHNQRGGVLASLSEVGEKLKLLPKRQECQGQLTLTEWADKRQGWIFITSTQDTRDQIRPLHAVFIDLLMKRLMATSPDRGRSRPCWVIVDEAHSLKRLPSLYSALTEGRKYGLKLILGTQNKYQFEEHYDRSALTMLSAPHLKIFLRSNEPGSAKWVSDLIGESEREKPRTGVTASVSDQGRDSINYSLIIERKAVISREEIMALPNLAGFWKYGDSVVPFRFRARAYRQVAEGFMPRQSLTAKIAERPQEPKQAGKRIVLKKGDAPQPEAGVTEPESTQYTSGF